MVPKNDSATLPVSVYTYLPYENISKRVCHSPDHAIEQQPHHATVQSAILFRFPHLCLARGSNFTAQILSQRGVPLFLRGPRISPFSLSRQMETKNSVFKIYRSPTSIKNEIRSGMRNHLRAVRPFVVSSLLRSTTSPKTTSLHVLFWSK